MDSRYSHLFENQDKKNVKVSQYDTLAEFLSNKLNAGLGIEINILNPSGVEKLEIKTPVNVTGSVQEQNSILAQFQLTTTNATSIYTPPSGYVAIIRGITITNTGGPTATISIFHDDDGTTYNNTTALYEGVTVTGNNALPIDEIEWYISNGGNLAVKTNKANETTITVFGIEIPSFPQGEKILFQGELPTSNTSLYSPPSGHTSVLRNIVVCNTHTSATNYSLYIDEDGTTYDKTTAIRYNTQLTGKSVLLLQEKRWVLDIDAGSFGGSAANANRITVTIYGKEYIP